ncbi:MAG: serine hydrolase domain-containing protein [Hyphomonas sp.]
MFTRRTLLTCLSGAALAACTHRADALRIPAASARRRIEDLVFSAMVPAAGLLVRHREEVVFAHAEGRAQGAAGEAEPLPFRTDTPMRVASVSKMVVALAARRLAAKGVIDLDADIRGLFSPPLVHPEHPGMAINLYHLLSHTSGLRDPEVYWMPAPGRTEDLFTDDMWSPEHWSVPGVGFRYCNFGYGLAGALLEQAAGERLDRIIAREVLLPLQLDAGFNWSGVSSDKRRRGATLYTREDDGRWQIQADGPDNLKGQEPVILKAGDFRLEDYRPGSNGTLFSPQGGLRASLEDMAVLARAAALEMPEPRWAYDRGFANGDTDGDYFEAFGAGVQLHMPGHSPVPGISLTGHHGEAYGLYSGAFHAPDLDAEIAFAVTGSSVSGGARSVHHPVVVKATEPLWAAAETLLGAL